MQYKHNGLVGMVDGWIVILLWCMRGAYFRGYAA